MLDPSLKDKEGLPLTIRAVFIVGELGHTAVSPESLCCHGIAQSSATPEVRLSQMCLT